MSLGIVPISCGIVAPRSEYRKNPVILDESMPHPRDPQVIMNERMRERILEKAKNKPDEERNMFDYLILAQEKLEEFQKNSVKYLA